ncbi:MAG: class I SAM-dependent methyltransferase [Bryobacteraceae bacterium]
MRLDDLLEKMKSDWDERARENPRYYIADCRRDWSEADFLRSGDQTLTELILTDMLNICQGRHPRDLRVLEIGCGAGRVTRPLARLFGEVHAVDVSGEMVALARNAVAGLPNARIYRNSGADLDVLGPAADFDFAFSTCVFHHIPSKAVIETYIREVARRLRPGCLFKFEVQGYLAMHNPDGDTWLGAPLSEPEMHAIAGRTGFEARYSVGAGEERYWHWFFKRLSGVDHI